MTTAAPAHALLAALQLGDGRFPAGGHAHSAGAEAACADGRIVDEATLEAFVEGRLRTTGLVDAALAAATTLALARCTGDGGALAEDLSGDPADLADPAGLDAEAALAVARCTGTPGDGGALAGEPSGELAGLDAEADARIAAPPLRDASRRLGRQLVRVGARCWPDPILRVAAEVAPDGLHQAVALGAVGTAAGLTPAAVAALAVHHAVTTPAQAAVRLLGLDPFGVAAVTARLAPVAAGVAAEALAAAEAGDPAELPAAASPLVDIAAVEHRTWDVRMFAT